MTNDAFSLGAVAYDPKVVTIWEGMREHFRSAGRGARLRALLQLRAAGRGAARRAHRHRLEHAARPRARAAAHRAGARCRSACATPIATSAPRSSCGATPASRRSRDLAGKTLAVGSRDSTQARILPLHFLRARRASTWRACGCLPFDTDLGKHGDTGTSELDVLARAAPTGARRRRARRSGLGAASRPPGASIPRCVEVLWTTPPLRPLHVRRAADAGARASAKAFRARAVRHELGEPGAPAAPGAGGAASSGCRRARRATPACGARSTSQGW